MNLYKLRSLDGTGLHYLLDMIVKERLYLSTCTKMNDVDEGNWEYMENKDKTYIENAEKLRHIVNRTRFTSFLSKINNPLMWAHYAGGFSGVALEYDIDETKLDLREIDYHGTPFITSKGMEDVVQGKLRPQDIGLLKQKAKCWDYETEWRLFGEENQEYIENIKPIRIIFGVRPNDHIEVLRDISKKYGLKRAYMNQISDIEYEVFNL